jgi:hypothetical protein
MSKEQTMVEETETALEVYRPITQGQYQPGSYQPGQHDHGQYGHYGQYSPFGQYGHQGHYVPYGQYGPQPGYHAYWSQPWQHHPWMHTHPWQHQQYYPMHGHHYYGQQRP